MDIVSGNSTGDVKAHKVRSDTRLITDDDVCDVSGGVVHSQKLLTLKIPVRKKLNDQKKKRNYKQWINVYKGFIKKKGKHFILLEKLIYVIYLCRNP